MLIKSTISIKVVVIIDTKFICIIAKIDVVAYNKLIKIKNLIFILKFMICFV